MKQFVFEMSVGANNLCNLSQERDLLIKEINIGRRLIVFGRRNTGKTSLLRNVVIPAFQSQHKQAFVLFADLMGLSSLEDLSHRLQVAFAEAIAKTFPIKSQLKTVLNFIKGVRPMVSIDPVTGEPSLSIEWQDHNDKVKFEAIFNSVGEIHKKSRALIVLDEFQDLAFVKGGEAKLRSVLQHLPHDLSIVMSGSKKHLLAKIFAVPSAPFASWGRDVEIPTIETKEYQEEYLRYVNERFALNKISISLGDLKNLLSLVQGVPEPANIVCDKLLRSHSNKVIGSADVRAAFVAAVEERRSRLEEKLMYFKEGEKSILMAIAKHGPIAKPKGKDFLHMLKKLSPTAIYTAIKRLEDHAEIYLTKEGYIVSDPLFSEFLRRYR